MLRSSGSASLLPVVSAGSSKTLGGGRRRAAGPASGGRTSLRSLVYLLLVLALGTCLLLTVALPRARDARKKRTLLSAGPGDLVTSVPGVASEEALATHQPEPEAAAHDQTLVLYVFAGSDPEYLANFRYFLREGVHENDGCQYVIAIQEGPGLASPDPLPQLPPNARVVRHENKCFDLGTVGWLLRTQVRNVGRYRYVVWLNSSVRGPFLPAYVRRHMHWTEALTDRLSARVKMVGATINCGGAHGAPAVPHVQSYLAAVDQAGLQALTKEGRVFECHDSLAQTVIHGELGASAAIFMAGYSIDSLMLRYQGVNWRSRGALDCNAGMNPLQHNFNDGISVDPFEVMFVKVKASMRGANWTHVRQAVKFAEWSEHEHGLTTADLRSNEWVTNELPRLEADAMRRGAACFDWAFYVAADRADLSFMAAEPDPRATAFQHYLAAGLREGRPARFTC